MKINYLLILIFPISFFSSAQVLCVSCYDQNARVLTNTNNLVANGGFEITTCLPYTHYGDTSFCPNSANYFCDISNWVCSGGGSLTYAHIIDTAFSPIVEGALAAYFGNRYCYT